MATSAGGDMSLSAGRNLNLAAVQSSTEFHEQAGKSSLDITRVTSDVTSLDAGGDLTATAGGDAVLVGVKAEAGGAVDLAAGGSVIMTAAQDFYSYASQTKKGGFLSKKIASTSITELTHSGVAITAAGDMAITAGSGDLVSAGARLASTGGNIGLSAVEGDILAGTFTDVFESQSYSKRSILGGLFGSTRSETVSNRLNTGTAALAELDLSLVSGEDTTLIGAELAVGGKLSITTGGNFSVQAAIDSQRRAFFSNKMGLVTMTTITERSFRETASLSSFAAAAGYAFAIGGEASLTLYDYAGTDAANPQNLYPQELLAIEGLKLLQQSLADEYFYDKQVALSPAFKALVSIVVSTFVVPGLFGALGLGAGTFGGGTLGTAIFNGAKAFASTFIVESLDGAVSGNFDIGEILKGATFSGVTAGLTSAINLPSFGQEMDKVLNESLLGGFGNGRLTLAGILDGAIDGAISSGLSSIVYGTDFGTGFSKALLNTVVNLAMADIQGAIGGLGLAEGSLPHALLHGLAGCAAAAATGNACAAGAAAAVAQSLFAGYLNASGSAPQRGQYASDKDYQEAYATWSTKQANYAALIGGIAGYVFSAGKAENVTVASSIAQSGLTNNYLTHANVSEMVKELEACKAKESGCSEAEQKNIALKYAGISLANDKKLLECYSEECVSKLLANAATYDEVMAALREVSPVARNIINALGSAFVSQYAADQVARNIDFANGYKDYQTAKCAGLSEAACRSAYVQAYYKYSSDIQTVEDAKKILAVITGGAIGIGSIAPAALNALRTCVTNLACLNELGIAMAEIAAGDALGGGTLTIATSAGVASGTLVLKKGDQIIGYLDHATGLSRPTLEGLEQALAALGKGVPHSGIPDSWIKLNPTGAQINTPKGFTSYRTPDGDIFHVSPEGLIYGKDNNFVNRVDHVLAHTFPDPSKPKHSVFNAQGDSALALVDEAWKKKGTPVPNDPGAYIVPMGKVVGTAGETSIKVVVKPGTTEILTAYPF